MNDTNIRSIAKTITWRLTGTGATFLISYLVSGNFTMAGTVAIIQMFANTALYYLHERLWNTLEWEKR